MAEEANLLFISCIQSFFLGIIQGFTEFLPISSTAHLKVIPYFLGWSDPGVSISASLQLGSAIAIVYYFRKDLIKISNSLVYILNNGSFFYDENTTLATYIVLANIPIFTLGLYIKLCWTGFSDSYLRGLFSIAIISIIMAFLLAISDILCKRKKSFSNINLKDIILLGVSQSLAVFPGVSRSGITLTSALFSGIKRQTAAKLSFLVGIPAVSISGLVELFTLFRTLNLIIVLPTIIGVFSSFFSSLIAIDFLIKFLAKNNTLIFCYYRLAFGMFILANLYF